MDGHVVVLCIILINGYHFTVLLFIRYHMWQFEQFDIIDGCVVLRSVALFYLSKVLFFIYFI